MHLNETNKMDRSEWKHRSDPVDCTVHSFITFVFCFFYICITSLHHSVKPSKAYSRGSVVMVDEIMNASPSKFRFPEAGLRVMVTSHFGPKTRLRMASRLIITEVQLCVVTPIRGFSCYCYTLRVCTIFRESPYIIFISDCRNIKNVAVAQQSW